MHHGTIEDIKVLTPFPVKSKMADALFPEFSVLNRYNVVTDCSIALKFCTQFDQVTVFKVKESEIKMT